MLQLIFPKFPAELRQLGACVIFENPEPTQLQWVRDNKIDEVRVSLDGGRYADFVLGELPTSSGEAIHFHVEIFRTSSSGKKTDTLPLEEVAAKATAFVELMGPVEVSVQSCSKSVVPRKELPSQGMIAGLLGFTRPLCGAQFSLSGGHLEIDDEVFEDLWFDYDEEDDTVQVNLWSFADIVFGLEYLATVAELAKIGTGRFVYERISRESSYAQ